MGFIYRILLLFCISRIGESRRQLKQGLGATSEDSRLRHHQSSRLSRKTIRRRTNEESTFEKSTSRIVAQVATCSRSRWRNSCDRFGWAIPCKLPAFVYFAKTIKMKRRGSRRLNYSIPRNTTAIIILICRTVFSLFPSNQRKYYRKNAQVPLNIYRRTLIAIQWKTFNGWSNVQDAFIKYGRTI